MSDDLPVQRRIDARWLMAWSAVLLLGHAPWLNAPFVNQEFAFSEAARTFVDPSYTTGLERYWRHQANPLGYSLLTALLWKLHVPAAFWSARLWSLAGGLLLLLAGWMWAGAHPLPRRVFPLWCALVTLCPLVWLYAGRGTADVLPVGLVTVALGMAWLARGRWTWHVAAAAIFALSVLVKWNALLLGLGFLFLVWTEPQGTSRARRWGQSALYVVLPGAALGLYVVGVYWQCGVWLMGDRFRGMHDPLAFARQSPAIAAAYLSYLAMLPGLVALIAVWGQVREGTTLRRVALASGWLAVGCGGAWLLNGFDLGEMNFGAFDRWLPAWAVLLLRGGCLAIGLSLLASCARAALADRDRAAGLLWATVVPFLAVSSCSRPAQRYLLFCLPLLLFVVLARTRPRDLRLTQGLGWVTASLFAVLSLIGMQYAASQGAAAERMAQWIVARGAADATDPGAIASHAAQHFPLDAGPARYVVRDSTSPGSLHVERVRLWGRAVKTFGLYAVGEAGASAVDQAAVTEKRITPLAMVNDAASMSR